MNKKTKLRQQEELESTVHHGQAASLKSFESVEALLREDAATIEVPASLRQKLETSIEAQPAEKSWWRRFCRRRPDS